MSSATVFRVQNGWIFDHTLSRIKKDFWIFGLPIVLGFCIIVSLDQVPGYRGSFLSKPGIVIAFLFSIFLDLPHVYSSFVRIGLDHEDFKRRQRLYLGLPLVLLFVVYISATISQSMTISIITYLNMVHRIRQDFGWVMYSRRMALETRGMGLWLDKMMAYNLTIFPLIWLHTLPPQDAWWLFPGDLAFGISNRLGQFLLYIHWTCCGVYIAWVGISIVKGQILNLAKIYIFLSIWAAWYAGLVFFNGSTWMIDLFHTMPYLFLIYHFSSKKWTTDESWRGNYVKGFRVWLVYFALVSIAYLTLKVPGADQFVWLYALLVLPSVTHYVLDGFIWKTGQSNPQLSGVLGFPSALSVSR